MRRLDGSGFSERCIARAVSESLIGVCAGLFVAAAASASAFAQISYDEDPINYSRTAVSDPVARLASQVESGEVTLTHDPKFGYLPSVLQRLGIPVASQVLVFSKTSLQFQRISPST